MKFLSIEPLLEDLGQISLDGINWVIVGGESGPGAREMKEDWVVSLQEQCAKARVPFFFKQWGGVRKKVRGRLLKGRTFDEYPPRTSHIPLPTEARLASLRAVESSLHEPSAIESALNALNATEMAAD